MALAVERFDARPWSEQQLDALFAEGFPVFITADQQAKTYIRKVREWFPEFNIALVDAGELIVAAGWGVPIRWSGEVDDLPSGYTDTLRRAVDLRETGGEPDTFVICGGIVHPDYKGSGLAGDLIIRLCQEAEVAKLPRVLASLRPTLKDQYPLVDIDEYILWTRYDGTPFDPWLRLHVGLGGRVIATAPKSQTMTGTVAEWELWTGLVLPVSSEYVIPRGLATLLVDRDADHGVYVEPNIWIQHS